MAVCTITGEVLRTDGQTPAAGAVLTVKKVLQDGALISTTNQSYTADEDGIVTLTILRDSVAYISGPVEGFNVSAGVAVTIPDAATADLEDLVPALNAPSTAVSQAVFNTHVASVLHHTDVPDSYAGHALKMVRVNAGATALEFADADSTYATDAQLAAEVATLNTALAANATADRARANHTGTQLLSTISDAGSAAALNVPASGNAAVGEVVKGNDTRLTDSRTPSGGCWWCPLRHVP